MLYSHWRAFKGNWSWANFSAVELSCRCCGEYYHCPQTLDALQKVREAVARPIVINSAHRCVTHNKAVGGAASSKHLEIAIDIQAAGHNRKTLLAACEAAGFKGFGFYRTFLHVDMGTPRAWGNRDYWK